MKLTGLRPILWVDQVRATLDWYITELGFEEGDYVEEWQWARICKDDVEIMLARPNAHIPYSAPAFTGSFYLRTGDVNAWWEKLKNKSYVFYPVDNFSYGMREFAIRDCNGYILQFGQEWEASIEA